MEYEAFMPMTSAPNAVLIVSGTVSCSALTLDEEADGDPSKTKAPPEMVAVPDSVTVAGAFETPVLTTEPVLNVAGATNNWLHVVLLAPWSAMKTREATSRREEDMVFLEQGRSVLFTGEEKRYVSLYPPCHHALRATRTHALAPAPP
jgi:hypothetical protein